MKQGKFITFEGLDGAGKSTHIEHVVEALRGRGLEVVQTREPGGTPVAEKIRALLLSETMDLATETMLMFAARQSHVSEVIRPALESGQWVVCDRFTDATYAYQGGGRGVPSDRIASLEDWVHRALQPHLTILFDLPFEVARTRIGETRNLDRFEREAADFHNRVRTAYLDRAQDSKGRIVVIDAAKGQGDVGSDVLSALERLFP